MAGESSPAGEGKQRDPARSTVPVKEVGLKISKLAGWGLLLGAFLVAGCVKTPEEQELRKSGDKLEVVLEGVIEPRREAKIVAPLSGRLRSVAVKNGARVKIDQALGEYHPGELMHAYRKAQVEYEKTALMTRVVTAAPRVVNRDALANAKERVMSTHELYRRDKASLAEVKSAEDAYLSLLHGARDQERVLKVEQLQVEKSRREAGKDVERSRLELDQAREVLNRARIVAPIAGFVTGLKAYPEQSFTQGEVLGSVIDIDAVVLKGSFSPGIYPYLKKGMSMEVSCLTTPPYKVKAAVREITPVVDPQTKRMTLEIPLQNEKYLLQPGDKCVISIVLSAQEAAAAGLAGDDKKVVIRSGTQ